MLIPKKAMHSAGVLSDPELFNRIRSAPLPTTRDGSEFARALAIADDMPMSDARDVEREYRRFLYLDICSDEPRVAPAAVRLAWQMHAQSPDYESFCLNVLGRPLPLEDASRNLGATGAYRRTRQAYMREFGDRPPRLIWPDGISPRLPRWIAAHMAVLGLTGTIAYGEGAPVVFAAGVALSLAIYGIDLYLAHFHKAGPGFGSPISDDLTFFLSEEKSH